VFLLLCVFAGACASGPKPPRTDDAPPLVIPPLGSASIGPITTSPGAESTPRDSGLSIAARDPRPKRKPRSRTHVLNEIQSFERQLSTSQPVSIDRAGMLRRLAEDYVELTRTSDGQARVDARKSAIDNYETLVREHGSVPTIDEVHYYLGLELELSGDFAKARRSYYQLIQSSPSSKLIPLAYFAFGEMFSEEAETDPTKNELALQAYKEVLKYPAAENPIVPEALRRLAQTHERKGEPVEAKAAFDRLFRDHPHSEAARKASGARAP
jgi:TolA-binding protein